MVKHLAAIETKFEGVIIVPSSFDDSVLTVRSTLAATKARAVARDWKSFPLRRIEPATATITTDLGVT
jgi:hypothetical protein